jgi:uncharacterized protein (TIGR00725 family)
MRNGISPCAHSETTRTVQSQMALKIGVMGGATGVIRKDHLDKAHRLGRAIAKNRCVLITGACPGLPLAAACGAKQAGGTVVGVSPGLSLHEHLYKYRSPTEFHDVLVFTGSGLMGREIVNIRSSDIVVIIGGRSGTLGELAIAYDEGKLIGVLTGTGGISDIVADILAACKKDTGARVIYDKDPQKLITRLVRLYGTAHYQRPSCFCADGDVAERGNANHRTVIDPVCGMEIAPRTAAAERLLRRKRYYFCSTGCARRFDADARSFVKAPMMVPNGRPRFKQAIGGAP